MSQVKMSAVALAVGSHGAVISDAVSNEVKVRDKWLALGKTLYADGVRVAMLVPSTEKHPNESADAGLIETIERFVIAGLSASKKGLKFDTQNPRATGKAQMKGQSVWSIADLLSLSRDELRTIDDETLKNARRYWQQQCGSMMGKIKGYVDRFENPEKARAEKAEKAAAKADAPTVTRSIEGYVACLNEMLANRNVIGLSARDAENLGDKLADALAFLRTVKRADDANM